MAARFIFPSISLEGQQMWLLCSSPLDPRAMHGNKYVLGKLPLVIGTLSQQYDTENAAQMPTSFGGLVFMLLAIALLGVIIVLEAIPVTAHLRAFQAGQDDAIDAPGMLAFATAGMVMLLAGIITVRLAAQRLGQLEV